MPRGTIDRKRLQRLMGVPTIGPGWMFLPVVGRSEEEARRLASDKADALVFDLDSLEVVATLTGNRILFAAKLTLPKRLRRC